jgi:multidrug transporter EmrE-like cation transporter
MVQKKTVSIILVLVSILLVNVGQLLLKYGLNSLESIDFTANILLAFFSAFTNFYIFVGVVLFVSSSLFWLVALARAPLSFAFPLLSLGYVVVSILSWIFLGEFLSTLRIVGLGVIVSGVVLMSRT